MSQYRVMMRQRHINYYGGPSLNPALAPRLVLAEVSSTFPVNTPNAGLMLPHRQRRCPKTLTL